MPAIPGFRTAPPTVAHVVVAAVPIRYLFSGEFRFSLPWFQRAYAWTPAQIASLASGIREAMKAGDTRPPYPLGTLILARPPLARDTALVDGHQRIMTLTILFAVLRDLEPDSVHRARYDALIAEPGKDEDSRAYRLEALADATDLLISHVQTPGSTLIEPEAEWAELSMSERHIIENRDFLRAELSRLLPDATDRRRFADYLLDNCWVIVHLAEDEDEAWRRLRLDEDTRLEFDAENRAKASLLSIVPPDQRQIAADGWARCEQLLEPDEIVALLGHLRRLNIRTKGKKRPLEVDIAEHFELRRKGRAFIEDTLLPQARTMRALVGARIACAGAATPLTSLGWLDRDLWLPAALLWQAERGADDTATADFYRSLDRLMWMMRIGGVDPTTQERRVGRIVAHIRSAADMADCVDLQIEAKLRTAALTALRSPRLGTRRFVGALLRRISLALGSDPGPVAPLAVTIEHLLPRNPERGSQWLRSFRTKKQVDAYADRLGNLTFMTDDENQAVGNHDWEHKRPVLATTRFALSVGLDEATTWNAAAIDARTERLIGILFAAWELSHD